MQVDPDVVSGSVVWSMTTSIEELSETRYRVYILLLFKCGLLPVDAKKILSALEEFQAGNLLILLQRSRNPGRDLWCFESALRARVA